MHVHFLNDQIYKDLKRILSIAIIIFSISLTSNATGLHPADLTCEYLKNPLGIDVSKPRLSWILTSAERSQNQSAYELIVSDNMHDINAKKGNMWESRKVITSNSLNILYSGKALKSFTRYYWCIKVYDGKGSASAWSDAAWFETAFISETGWKAKWIGDGSKQFDSDEDFYKDDLMPLFRKEFYAHKKIVSARLYICGLGYYEAYLNGNKIGDHVLDPGFTTYRKQALYVTYDITTNIASGKNALGIMLGNGWYNPLPLRLFGRFNLRDVQQTGRPCVKAEVLLKYADGTLETILTDESWKVSQGPVIRNNVYLGEEYNATLEITGWNNINFNAASWRNAVQTQGPSGHLTAQLQPAVKVTKIIKPVSINIVGRDTFIADMGQNFAGVARITVKGAKGKKVTLRYGEDTLADGSLNYLTTTAGHIKEMWNLKGGPGAPKTAWQQDSYILKGGGLETWSPRFTFHGFRYVEITGWPGTPVTNNIEGLRMNADVLQNGNFSCSNTMFNKLNDVIKWTFLSNIFSVQSDCPGREKMGYGADIVVTSKSFIYNFDMTNFYRKTVTDYANEQQPDGGITEIAPSTGIADRGYGGQSGPAGWELAFPYVQKQLYDFYGDRKIIEDNYQGLQKQVDFLRSKTVDETLYWDISDHESIDSKPEAFSAAAFYYHHVLLASEFAGILGKVEDSIKYAGLCHTIKDAIISKYWIDSTGRFDNGTQAAQIFALWYGFAPDKQQSLQVLNGEFARHKWHLSTGIFATEMLFEVLRSMDQNELAYKIANQKDYPGWGFMLANGATTLWESWKKPDQNSLNHPMFGSINEWFYRSLLGINSAAPAFKKIIVKPQPAGDLRWAKGSYRSVSGTIVSDWKKDDDGFYLHVFIPANTSAEIWIPSKEAGVITEGGNVIKAGDINFLKYENGYKVFATGSGDYNFNSKP